MTNLTVLGSVGVLSLLIVMIAALQKRFFWVRQLAFPRGAPDFIPANSICCHPGLG